MGQSGDMPYTLDPTEDGQWQLFDKATGKKVKGGKYPTRTEAMKRLRELLKQKDDKPAPPELEDDAEEEDE